MLDLELDSTMRESALSRFRQINALYERRDAVEQNIIVRNLYREVRDLLVLTKNDPESQGDPDRQRIIQRFAITNKDL